MFLRKSIFDTDWNDGVFRLGDDAEIQIPNSFGAGAAGASSRPAAARTDASIPTLASYLVSGYWAYSGYDGVQPRSWAYLPNHVISVNISGLNGTEQNYATTALRLWADVANVSFTFVTSNADITYVHTGTMVANSSDTTPVSGQNYTHVQIDISSDWVTTNGGFNDGRTGYFSYGFQTYVHETGHALGLGHQGPYNGGFLNSQYNTASLYNQDTWQFSTMSYEYQSNYDGSSFQFILTPQMADIYAIQSIYGAATTRTGNNTYGFNATDPFYNFANYSQTGTTGSSTPAFTIYDSGGGDDTLDASGYSQNQIIDLRPGAWSSIGGLVNNIGISTTTNLENAVGGGGDDLIIANPVVFGRLTGGGGNDTFQSSLSGFSGDTVTDLGVGDRINFTDGNGAFQYVWNATSLMYGNGSNNVAMSLSNNPRGHLIISMDPSGGVDLTMQPQDDHLSDFGGDGHSDILFQNDNGLPAIWSMNGSSILSGTVLNYNPGTAWHAIGTGVFTPNEDSSILWQASSGSVAIWNMTGSTIDFGTILSYNPGPDWHVIQAGDFNNDRQSDILLQNNNGAAAIWLMNGDTISSGTILPYNPGPDWKAIGTGDFNRDGNADILWHEDISGGVAVWLMNGQTINSGTILGYNPGPSWQAIGAGDFEGTGFKDDILFQNQNGTLAIWNMNGATITNGTNLSYNPGSDWHAVGIGDFSDSGKDGILFQNVVDGSTAIWAMNGTNIVSGSVLGYNAGPSWHAIA